MRLVKLLDFLHTRARVYDIIFGCDKPTPERKKKDEWDERKHECVTMSEA